MRKYFASFIAWLFLVSVAFAADTPVPDDVLLKDLPTGSKLLFVKNVDFRFRREESDFWVTYGGNGFYIVMLAKRDVPEVGDTIAIKSVDGGSMSLDTYGWSSAYLAGPKTAGDIRDITKGDIIIVSSKVYSDPYKDLPEEVKQDLLMSKIVTAIKEDKYQKAIPIFEYMEKDGKPLPESFYYYYMLALDKTGSPKEAKERGFAFLKKYGKSSKYYQNVLELVSK